MTKSKGVPSTLEKSALKLGEDAANQILWGGPYPEATLRDRITLTIAELVLVVAADISAIVLGSSSGEPAGLLNSRKRAKPGDPRRPG